MAAASDASAVRSLTVMPWLPQVAALPGKVQVIRAGETTVASIENHDPADRRRCCGSWCP